MKGAILITCVYIASTAFSVTGFCPHARNGMTGENGHQTTALKADPLPSRDIPESSTRTSRREQKREIRRQERVTRRKAWQERNRVEGNHARVCRISAIAEARKLRYRQKLKSWETAANEGPTLVIDCSWEREMTKRNIRSLVQQVGPGMCCFSHELAWL